MKVKGNFQYREIVSEKDIEEAYKIYQTNEAYFKLVSNKLPELQDVMNDKNAIPENAAISNKHYGLYSWNDTFVAVVDILESYPDEDAVYIGLFIINGNLHRAGYGTMLMQQIEEEAKRKGYKRIRLGVVEGNEKGMAFWMSLGFKEVKTVVSTVKPETNWTVHVMEKYL